MNILSSGLSNQCGKPGETCWHGYHDPYSLGVVQLVFWQQEWITLLVSCLAYKKEMMSVWLGRHALRLLRKKASANAPRNMRRSDDTLKRSKKSASCEAHGALDSGVGCVTGLGFNPAGRPTSACSRLATAAVGSIRMVCSVGAAADANR